MDIENTITPAARVVRKFGGINPTAKALRLHRSVVNRWLLARDKGGTGGLVPAKHQQTLMQKAEGLGVDLSPNDFFEIAAS